MGIYPRVTESSDPAEAIDLTVGFILALKFINYTLPVSEIIDIKSWMVRKKRVIILQYVMYIQ